MKLSDTKIIVSGLMSRGFFGNIGIACALEFMIFIEINIWVQHTAQQNQD